MTANNKYKGMEKRIKSRRKTDQDLLESLEKFNTLFQHTSDQIIYLNQDGNILDVNTRVLNFYASPKDDIIGKHYSEIKEFNSKGIHAVFDTIVEEKSLPINLDFVMNKKEIFLEGTASLIEDGGDVAGILLILRDFTERRRVEERLKESEEKLNMIVDNANDVISFIDIEGKVIDVNKRVEDMFGFKREEVIGKYISEVEFFSLENLEEAMTLLDDFVAERPLKKLEYEGWRKDKTKVFIEINPKLIKKDGEVIGVLNISRDITERKLADEALQQYREQLEEKVSARTADLEEANNALRIMLKKEGEIKKELEEKIIINVRQLISPYIEIIKNCRLDNRAKKYIEILEMNLNEIISPFLSKSDINFLGLTPTEIQVANLIKQGKTTKDIAKLLNLATSTIDTHRKNLRKKMGITSKGVNLRSYLLSFQNG